MRAGARRLVPLLLLALGGCAAGGAAPSGVPRAPGAAGVHPGFDTQVYPGDELMRAWREASPYRWVGYYLTSPCHRGTSWAGKRAALSGMGWGIAVLYVGQQVFEGAPLENPGVEEVLCSRTLLSEEQGRRDARDAIARAAGEGFTAGSVVYLDVERMQRTPPEMLAYLRGWTRELLVEGRYRPGVYAHRANAPELYLVAAEVYRDRGRAEGPPFWVAGGDGFALDQPPQAAGLPFVDVWQGALDVDRTWAGATLRVDENVAEVPSPSAPR